MSYDESFTIKDIEAIAESGRNTVVSYPAGTGKTTAIINYVVKHKFDRVIYIAPTISILQEFYDRLLNKGIPDDNIASIWTGSKYWNSIVTRARIENRQVSEVARLSISSKRIVLITHKKMLFEDPTIFTGYLNMSNVINSNRIKFITFIDEAVEPCIFGTCDLEKIEHILMRTGLISLEDKVENYQLAIKIEIEQLKSIEGSAEYESALSTFYDKVSGNINKITGYLTSIDKLVPMENGKYHRYRLPSEWSIYLSDNTGFEYKIKTYNDYIDHNLPDRLTNLYTVLARQIVLGDFKIKNDIMYVDIPIAMQRIWSNIPNYQSIIMDATAHWTKSMYTNLGYSVYNSDIVMDIWNFNKVNLYKRSSLSGVSLSKTNFMSNPELIIKCLDLINFSKYNKIYLSTFKLNLELVAEYLNNKYPEYTILNHSSINDLSVDEDFNDSVYASNEDKVIYIANYGRTRGSNLFRSCDCVIQLGIYLLPPDVTKLQQIIYTELGDYDLAIANFIQEMYRGQIRCDKPMDCYLFNNEGINNAINELPFNSITELKTIDNVTDSDFDLIELIRNSNYRSNFKSTIDYVVNNLGKLIYYSELSNSVGYSKTENAKAALFRWINNNPQLLPYVHNNENIHYFYLGNLK